MFAGKTVIQLYRSTDLCIKITVVDYKIRRTQLDHFTIHRISTRVAECTSVYNDRTSVLSQKQILGYILGIEIHFTRSHRVLDGQLTVFDAQQMILRVNTVTCLFKCITGKVQRLVTFYRRTQARQIVRFIFLRVAVNICAKPYLRLLTAVVRQSQLPVTTDDKVSVTCILCAFTVGACGTDRYDCQRQCGYHNSKCRKQSRNAFKFYFHNPLPPHYNFQSSYKPTALYYILHRIQQNDITQMGKLCNSS